MCDRGHILVMLTAWWGVTLAGHARAGDEPAQAPPRPLLTIPIENPFIEAMAFSPDGKTLAVAVGRQVRLFDTASGQKRLSLDAKGDGRSFVVERLAFSPDGETLVAGGGSGDSIPGPEHVTLTALELPGGQRRSVVPNLGYRLGPMAFSDDGKSVRAEVELRGGWASQTFDAATWSRTGSRPYRHEPRLERSESPDGRVFVLISKDTVSICERETGVERSRAVLEGVRNDVTFAPRGDVLAVGNLRGSAWLWKWDERGSEPVRLGGKRGKFFPGFEFSPDGSILADRHDEGVTLWDVAPTLKP
jgi:WD40 repeat protein